jgi:glycosyltransferase involved in cell wall biosynthesis
VIACLAAWGTGKPVIITAIGSGSIKKLQDFGPKSWLLRWGYRQATRVTAISNYVARELQKEIPGLPVHVINPGVDYSFWGVEETTPLDTTLNELSPYFLTQGELKRRKGYSVLLPILKTVFNRHPEAHYVVIANTTRNREYFEELQLLINTLGLSKKITFLSDLSISELRRVYQKARGYVLLPQNIGGDVEGFGISILEASAAGVPVVVGSGSGADDAVSDQGGYLVNSSNKDEVLLRLTSLLENNTLREQLSVGARKWAESMDWDNQIKKYIRLYEEI